MAINSTHPSYAARVQDWDLLSDSYAGERTVKERGVVYLPPTSGMLQDGALVPNTQGWSAYRSYVQRGHYPDLVSDAVEAMLGVMHHKPPTIELPEAMEPLRENATVQNESLEMLLRRINEAQLVSGRIGLLVDLPEGETSGSVLPYIATYEARSIINWDRGRRDVASKQTLNLVVLDESEQERSDTFEWKLVEKYRVLVLGAPDLNETSGVEYRFATYREGADTFSESDLKTPSLRGVTLQSIPFTFINSKDIVADPDDPPLLGLANLTMAIYRGEADYRQALFLQGQDTLVVIGATDQDEEYRVGAGELMTVPAGGDAKYIGADSQGLSEMRTSLENDYGRAASKSGQMLDNVSREKESGDALRIRVAARTATLNQIALSGAYGLQEALRHVAVWMGLDPSQVVVTPNLDFVDDSLGGEELVKLVSAKKLGAPLSAESIHLLMQDKGLTGFTYEEELQKIEDEAPAVEPPVDGAPPRGAPEDPNQPGV